MLPHPVREGDMVFEQFFGVAPAAEPFPLGLLADIEQTHGDVDHRSSTASIIAVLATGLTPRAVPTP